MRKIILIIIVFQCFFAQAQNNVGPGIDSDLSEIGNISGMYAIGTFDNSDKSLDGSTMLFDDLTYAYFKLKINEGFAKEPVELNYDIQSRNFVLKLKDEYYSIQCDYVNEIKLLNSEVYTVIQEDDSFELAQKLVDGPVVLLSKPFIQIKKANYNVALNFGSKRDKATKKTAFFLKIGEELIELPKKRKKLKKVLRNHPELLKYLNSQKVKLKDRSNLIEVINNYNSKN